MKKTAFEKMVDNAFWALEARYAFKKTGTNYVRRSVTVEYKNLTTLVRVNYELGNTPWVEISDVNESANKSTLGWVLVELGVDKPPTPEQAFRPTPLGESALEPILQKMGQEMIEYAAELLMGNFTIMPKLQAHAKKYDLDCQRYLSIHK